MEKRLDVGSNEPVIDIQGLTKSFGSVHALSGLDLRVTSGEVHGFLGPNGAGKSTTIRILLGLVRRDGGKISVWRHDPWDDAVLLHQRMAYVPGDVVLWPNLTGGEAIDVLSRARGGGDRERQRELIDLFELDPSKRGATYSKGNRQKVAIIAALASHADLLVLDEPTSGLDPLMEAIFVRCIEEERAAGRTVLLSSHTLAQVERLCDRISIVRNGRTVESGSLAQLRHLTRSNIRVRTRHEPQLEGIPGIHDVQRTAVGELQLSVDAAQLDNITGLLHAAGIESLVIQPPTLEELFLSHYGNAEHSGNGEQSGKHGDLA
ncbi:ABC transporter ATP-binding protein [Ancrocorticia sp.]|uniref:ABC transporter ATP-binding protein n=1 Tax=Ancrocorticia sp. TaxID=2593684 RepID=UPI003F93BDD8